MRISKTSLFNVMSREFVLKNLIDGVRQDYDYILIDCMPSLGMMTINSLVAADSIIILQSFKASTVKL